MTGLLTKTYRCISSLFSPAMLFFALFYLYIWLFIEPRLIYLAFGTSTNFPTFLVGWSFFKGFLGYPGGPVEYAARFLSQYFYFSWIGALIITIIAWGIYWFTNILIAITKGAISTVISYIPPLLLLIMYNRYEHPLAGSLALLTALWFSFMYQKIANSSRPAAASLFLAAFTVLYYIGGGASLLFTVLAAIYGSALGGGCFSACSISALHWSCRGLWQPIFSI